MAKDSAKKNTAYYYWFWCCCCSCCLSVSLGDALDLILLFDGERVGGLLGAVDDLISEALGDGLDVAEGGVAGAGADQVDGLVDTAERGHIDGLTTDNTGRTDTGGVFAGTTGLDSLDEDLEGVLVGQEVDDLEGVLDDAHSEQLLTVAAGLHHHTADEALGDRAGSLAETLLLVAAGSVGEPHLGALLGHGDVIMEGQIRDGDVLVGPLSEKLSFRHGVE